jgi:hypothetical protein
MHYNILFAVVVIFCFHSVNAIEFKNCGSYFLFDNIQIEGCDDDATSCQLTIGSNTSISFTINTGKPYGKRNHMYFLIIIHKQLLVTERLTNVMFSKPFCNPRWKIVELVTLYRGTSISLRDNFYWRHLNQIYQNKVSR